MLSPMRFVEVTLAAPAGLVSELEAFYRGMTGETTLRFRAAGGDPFYHFALLVPGNRFDAAHAWAEERFELLGGVFEFENWDARAVYFLDPAGNITELIAHRGLEESGREGAFGPEEIVGFSELGLVGNRALRLAELEFPLWSGTIDDPERLAFVGEKGRTLILAEEGRGWLPTGRPAEIHPVGFELAS
jgi:catechol 2,3-dioxygenase-like lactoylglutathione lyase family enzyme